MEAQGGVPHTAPVYVEKAIEKFAEGAEEILMD